MTLFQGSCACSYDALWRREIWFSDFQVNYFFSLRFERLGLHQHLKSGLCPQPTQAFCEFQFQFSFNKRAPLLNERKGVWSAWHPLVVQMATTFKIWSNFNFV